MIGQVSTGNMEQLSLTEDSKLVGSTRKGFKRFFTSGKIHPLNAIEWEMRECTLKNETQDVIFKQEKVESPKFWSQMATTVVASKYLHGAFGTPERESGIRAMIERVVKTITTWGEKDGYFADSVEKAIFEEELSHILVHQIASFNSPVWFNVGVRDNPQCSACFIISVDDSIDSLTDLQALEARLFKYGSGTGTNFSTIRSSKESLSGGGVPSGPVSFMKAFDAWAGIIKSGGKTRRAAKMLILNADHPDILDFINCKKVEEKKAWALIEQGYSGSFAAKGGAYDSVAFQNANLSVRVSDEFMQAAAQNATYSTKRVSDGSPCQALEARKVLEAIAQGTYSCGDPGIQFDSTINAWHTCPNSGRINASNPCSEYMSLDNSACNLASINLLKFLKDDGSFDVEGYKHTIDIMLAAQDMLVDNSSYPSPSIEKCAHEYRQLGIGYTNLGALLMSQGVPYDSDQGRSWAAALTSILTGQAYCTSARVAEKNGAFKGYKKNRAPMLKIVEKHHEAATQIQSVNLPENLAQAAVDVWSNALVAGKRFGYRNSQVSVLAPTGTISFMMDCDTTGVEPEIALIKYKKLSDGSMLKLVNGSVTRGLSALGYSSSEIQKLTQFIEQNGTVEGASGFKPEHLPVFDCALRAATGTRYIHYTGHLNMMAAVQPFLSGAISKTVNLPHETTPEEIFSVYLDAWRKGLKAVALYRDGSKRTQPLNVKANEKEKVKFAPVRRRLPAERPAITHRFNIGGLEGYLTVGLYEDGNPGEIFLVVAKEGSTLSGVMDAFATAVSLALQHGVPLATFVKKFSHMRFDPSGFTDNKDIPMAKSVIDYVFRWMGLKFLSPEDKIALGISPMNGSDTTSIKLEKATIAKMNNTPGSGDVYHAFEDAPPCSSCGSGMMVRQANCYVCLNCGAQGGCG